MEGNGIIEVNGRMVCFGMKAAEIFSNFLIDQEKNGNISNWDYFVGILYAGLVNEDYNQRRPYTPFAEASTLADTLDKETQDAVYNCYENSKAGGAIQKNIEAMLEVVQKKSVEENPNQSIGQTFESMQPKMESATENLPG